MSQANFKLVGGAILVGGCVLFSEHFHTKHIKKAVKDKDKAVQKKLVSKR